MGDAPRELVAREAERVRGCTGPIRRRAAAAAAGRDEPGPGRSARDTGTIPVLEDVYAFGDHVRAWRAQTLPAAPLARARDGFACATSGTAPSPPSGSDADAPEWPFDE